MSVMDDFFNTFGEEVGRPSTVRGAQPHWYRLCVCGHLERYHAPSIGGSYVMHSDGEQIVRGITWQVRHVFEGCNGAVGNRGDLPIEPEPDYDHHVLVNRYRTTCPCERFRPVAEIDRPNRFFNQRCTTDRHPFTIGMQAFTTHLSRRKAALDRPSWATEELERRFRWLDGARVCSITKCKATGDGVWPAYVGPDRGSEMRCLTHRD